MMINDCPKIVIKKVFYVVSLIMMTSLLHGVTYYVDADFGSDSNTGLSEQSAFQTLEYAKNLTAGNGGMIVLSNGQYTFNQEKNLTRSNWLKIIAKDGHNPEISGDIKCLRYPQVADDTYLWFEGISIYGSIDIYCASHIRIIDCDFYGDGFTYRDGSNGISMTNCPDVIISGCTISGIGAGIDAFSTGGQDGKNFGTAYETGIIVNYGYKTENLLIENCKISGCGEGMSLHGDGMTIRNNEIFYCSDDGMVIVETNEFSDLYTIIENNYIHHMGKFSELHVDCIQLNDAYGTKDLVNRNLVIRNNVFHDCDQQGLFLRTDTSASENWIIENNLLYNTNLENLGSHAIRIMSVNGLIFRNNTVIPGNRGHNGMVIIQDYDDKCTVTDFSNNIAYMIDFYADDGVTVLNESNNIVCLDGHHNKTHEWHSNTRFIKDYEEFKAQFKDYENENYQISCDSVALDFCPVSNVPALDLNNRGRTDITGLGNDGSNYAEPGCFEYYADTTAPSVPSGLSGMSPSEFRISLEWDPSTDKESGINEYKIYRDGNLIGTTRETSYTDSNLKSNILYVYSVSCVNGDYIESAMSSEIEIQTQVDAVKPQIAEVKAINDNNLSIKFSEPMDVQSCTDKGNFSINKGITINNVQMSENNTVATLNTSNHIDDVYSLDIKNIKDESGNFINNYASDYLFNSSILYMPFDGDIDNRSDFAITTSSPSGETYGTGYINECLEGNGQADGSYVLVNHHEKLDGMEKLTISFWVKKRQAASSGVIINKHVTYHLEMGAETLGGYFINSENDRVNFSTTSAAINDAGWHHYLVAYDGQKIEIFIDGIISKTEAFSGSIISNPSRLIYIGKSPWGATFDGLIDELKIYSRALTEAEIKKIAGLISPSTDTYTLTAIGSNSKITRSPDKDVYVAGEEVTLTAKADDLDCVFMRWSMNVDDPYSKTTTITMNRNETVLADYREPVVEMENEKMFNQLVDFYQVSAKNMRADKGTIAMWVYPRALVGERYIFGHTTDEEWSNRIQIFTLNNYLCLGLGDSHVTKMMITKLQPGLGYHLILIWDNGQYKFYVDGIEAATGTYQGLETLNSFADIGNTGYLASRTKAFDGTIDDVKIYNEAVDLGMVRNLFYSIEASENNNIFVELFEQDLIGESISYSMEILGLPVRATFDAANALLNWRPWYDQAGTHEIMVKAEDSDYTQMISITVEETMLEDWYAKWLEDNEVQTAMIEY